jgi:hypothetical protein
MLMREIAHPLQWQSLGGQAMPIRVIFTLALDLQEWGWLFIVRQEARNKFDGFDDAHL